ncbi:outer membrane lipoprotein carrier protein LolA [Geotalea sp. SG265]|uniref:LolA family protein n=1 Tax=Geotalea sp. SG265 TaxID=2922867 RepID=UPI001FAFA0F4|nr:outer membrane lipoprotein carrier protein LolA [Geotalea sp. SG265]
MRRMLRSIIALMIVMTAFSAEAGTPAKINVGLQDVVDTVEKSYRALNTLTADFFQRSTIARENRELRAEGQMFLKTAADGDPLKFRFDYFRPTTQEIVSNGKTMWMYLPESRKVLLSDVSFVFDPSRFNPDRDRASNFLQGLGRISKDFLITPPSQWQDMEGNYILELTPRRATATIAKLFILVRRDAVLLFVQNNRDITRVINDPLRHDLAFPVLSTTVVDHQGNATIMEFSNIKANAIMSDQLFEFIIPAGVDVVRPSPP